MSEGGFTGRTRQRTTKRSVLLADLGARGMITVGGIGTIIAVSTVCIFLAVEVLPLFYNAEKGDKQPLEAGWLSERPIRVAIDEYRMLGWALGRDGKLTVFRPDTGKALYQQQLIEDRVITASSFDSRSNTLTLGYEDGSIQYGKVGFKSTFLDLADIDDEAVKSLPPGDVGEYQWKDTVLDSEGEEVEVARHAMVEALPHTWVFGPLRTVIWLKQLRAQYVTIELEKPKRVGKGPIKLVGHVLTDNVPTVYAYVDTEEPESRVKLIRSRLQENMMTGGKELKFLRTVAVPFEQAGAGHPSFLCVGSNASHTVLAWASGEAIRYRMRPPSDVFIAETLDLSAEGAGDGAKLSTFEYVIGRETLVFGHEDGSLEGWFTIPFDAEKRGFRTQYHLNKLWVFPLDSEHFEAFRNTGDIENKVIRKNALEGETDLVAPDDATIEGFLKARPKDGFELVRAKRYPKGLSRVTSIMPSQRTRMIAAGFEDGRLALYQTTTERTVLKLEDAAGKPVEHTLIAPKDDGLFALHKGGLSKWAFDPGHPEGNMKALFTKVWYEGYSEPRHMWQSSSGDDASEPKLGMMPLIFGTLKATGYSMLFGVPLALLAAIYTSEFLHPKVRARIKPTVELMASLPSVVLGFLAGIVIAKHVESHLAGVLAAFLSIPLAFLVGAYAWQMFPYRNTVRLREWRFPIMLLVVLPIGAWLGVAVLGPLLEDWMFLGDVKSYLSGNALTPRRGGAVGGWMILFIPLSALLVALSFGRWGTSWFRGKAMNWNRQQAATYDFLKFGGLLLGVFVLAYVLSNLAGIVIGDPRGPESFIDTYVQRNALVVGFIMGFAIIPIIYTIAEDALSTVPEHLRAASLGAGATPWQTAVRIIIPTAMSGLFSACMIGLGRAVGETMIVLMAAGNTPVLEWNMFNGFRTLSANIAVELPEADIGSTHYRTLFLAAFVLFVMTFILNTIAEVVRLRFRKRAYQL